MQTLIQIILATFLVSVIALIGIFTLLLNRKSLHKILIYLIALSIGGLFGGAFIHLLPEVASELPITVISIFILIGFFSFFIIEKSFHWHHTHHHHKGTCPFAYLNLIGDAIHNFIDGIIIAGSFLINASIGITTTLAILLHEIPQEIGDFGVLVYAGFKPKKALFFNFLTALTALLGGIVGYFLFSTIENTVPFILSFAIGGFLYIAASDLIPEIKEEKSFKKTLLMVLVILLGIALMFLL